MKNLFLFLILCLSLHARECVPQTFTTLSFLAQSPVKYEAWCNTLLPKKDSPTPTLEKSLVAWSNLCANVKLNLIYSVNNKRVLTADLISSTPYFWVGNPSKESASSSDGSEVHAAIVYFKDESVVIVNTIKVGEINHQTLFDFYVENVGMEAFVERTLFIYQVVKKNNDVDFKTLESLFLLEEN